MTSKRLVLRRATACRMIGPGDPASRTSCMVSSSSAFLASRRDRGRDMTCDRAFRISACAVACLLAHAYAALAQGVPRAKASEGLLVPGVQYGAPLRTGVSVALFIPTSGDGTFRRRGVIAEGAVGRGGASASFGVARFLEAAGLDARAAVYRTGRSPRGSAARSTYAGGEVGVTIEYVRVGFGVARRIAGASGPNGAIATWTVGVRVPIPIH